MTNKESRINIQNEQENNSPSLSLPFVSFDDKKQNKTGQKKKKTPFKRRNAVSVLTTEINFLNRGFTHC